MHHADPAAVVIFWVTGLYFCAVIGRYLAKYFKQPGVLGELLMGLLLGNALYFLGVPLFTVLREGPAVFSIMRDMLEGMNLHEAIANIIAEPSTISKMYNALSSPSGTDYLKVAFVVDIFARYGVIFLLFKVGLESSPEELKNTGAASLRVAVVGVLAPILCGLIVAWLMLPAASFNVDLFIAATLSATSVGITARVLTELKGLHFRESKTILGAAVIDDILGLIILAVVSAIVTTGHIEFVSVAKIISLTLIFLWLVLYIGPKVLDKMINLFRFIDPQEAKLFIAFIVVMTLAFTATVVNLATIIGAFAAGLILHDGFFKSLPADSPKIHHLIGPLESILAPLFFIVIGIQVKIEMFFDLQVLSLSFGLIIAAILGKLICGFVSATGDDKWFIGLGMLPRGEVGIVFASIGKTLGVIDDKLFAAIILMIIFTTFIAPPLLKWRFSYLKQDQSQHA